MCFLFLLISMLAFSSSLTLINFRVFHTQKNYESAILAQTIKQDQAGKRQPYTIQGLRQYEVSSDITRRRLSCGCRSLGVDAT